MQWQRWQQRLLSPHRPRRCRARVWQRLPRLECLETRLPPAAHNTLATAIPITLDSSQQAQIAGNLADSSQIDLYAVTLQSGQQLTANVAAQSAGSGLHAALRIFDAAGQPLDIADNYALDPVLSSDTGTAGTYFLGISDSGNDAYDPAVSGTVTQIGQPTFGSYTLTLSVFTPPTTGQNNTLATAERITGNTHVTGTLNAGDSDFFQLTEGEPGRLVVTATATDGTVLDPRLSLLDATGKLLIQSDETTAGQATAALDQHIQPGTYVLELSAARNTTNPADDHGYLLTTSFQLASTPFAALSTGDGVRSLAVADVNGDGVPDIITASAGEDAVSVLLGNGDGSFRPAYALPVSDGPAYVAVADINGDGIPDIITANTNYNTVSVLLGKGDGAFQPAVSIPVGLVPVSVAVADLTGNGHADIITADQYDNTVNVLLGNGDGSFQPAFPLPVGKEPQAVIVADLTGKGIPDIITANLMDNTVSVLLGNGDGTFQPAVSLPAGPTPDAVAVADVNGDGIPDIVVANRYINGVSVLLGNGDGSFQPAYSLPAGNLTTSVVVADVTGDGHPDIITANANDDTLSVLPGNGDGSFRPAYSISVGQKAEALALADLGNGHPDIVTANLFSDSVSVLLGNGDGTFRSASSIAVEGEPDSVVVKDVNRDGNPDIITANFATSSVSVLLGNGDGTFRSAGSYPVGQFPESVAVADLNEDGIPDIVSANTYGSSVSVLLGNGDGTFQPADTLPAEGSPVSVAVADVNGDGIPDIITANGGADTVSVLLGNGDGTFQAASTLRAGREPIAVAVADLGNGHPDIITADLLSSMVSVLLGNGDGTFQPPFFLRVGGLPHAVTVADLGNGHPDIITANEFDDNVSVLLGNGNTTFQPAFTLPVGNKPLSVAVGNLNGFPDIVTANADDDTVSVLLGKGNGAFSPAVSVPAGKKPGAVALADLTGDDHLDIIAANNGDDSVSVLLGNGQGSFSPPTGQSSVAGQDVPVLAPFNGESVPDALSLDQHTGQILYRAATDVPSDPYQPFVVVNPKYPAADFTLVQTANPYRPEIAALDAATDTVYLYAFANSRAKNPFKLVGSFRTGSGPVRIASADLTGDGLDDLVIANDFDGTLTIAFQLSSGRFASSTLTRPVGASPTSISFAHLDGQTGPPDIVIGDQASGDVTVLFNDPDHTFDNEDRYRAGPGVFDIAASPTSGTVVASQLDTVGAVAVSLMASGLPELLAVNAGTDSYSLLPNLGNSSFADPTSSTTFAFGNQTVLQVLLGDFTPSTTGDLAFLTTDAAGNSQVSIYLNNGSGSFSAPIVSDTGEGATGFTLIPAQPPRNPLVGPAQPGSPAHLLVGNAYGDFLTLTGDDDGHFVIDRSGLTGKPLAVGHAPDGTPFVVVTDPATGRVQVFLQDARSSPSGSSPFAAPVPLASSSQTLLAPGAVQLADLNKAKDTHGKPIEDLIVADRLGNDVLVFFGNADGSFSPNPYIMSVGFEPSAVAVGDLNGDGVLDLAVANEGSNDVSILDGQLSKGVWTATHGPRLSSGGSQPIAIAAGHFLHHNLLDLRVINAGGQVATLPGIGIQHGTGFFRPPQRIVNVGSTIVQSAFDPATGLDFLVLQDGSLQMLGGGELIAANVVAVSATGGMLIAGLADGDVEVMTETGADMQMETPDFIDQPSALQALLSGNQIDVYATYQGQDAPVLFTFAVPVITELPNRPAAIQASGLMDTNLILTAVLVQGSLVERVEVAAPEAIPGEEIFTLFARAGTAPVLLPDADAGDNPPGEIPAVVPANAEPPVAVPLQRFRLGVDEALHQWLHDQRPGARMDAVPEVLPGLQPPAKAPAPAEKTNQPPEEQEDHEQVKHEQEQLATGLARVDAEAEVEVVAVVDGVPVLVVMAWLMEREEEERMARVN